MSDHGFIQFIRSKAVEEFIRAHPLAFAILSLIAQRAKWKECEISSSQVGEAYIAASDFEGFGKAKGMTRQEFRTNLNKIVNSGFATSESTNKGTIVRLCNSDVYNISPKPINQPINQQSTSNQPLKKKVRRKEENPTPKKNKDQDSNAGEAKFLFLDRVYLTQKQHDDFQAECKELWPLVLQKLNSYIPNKPGKPYTCHASAIRQWVITAVQQDNERVKKFESIKKEPRRPVPEGVGKADPVEINMENL